MVSTITDRIAFTVPGGAVSAGGFGNITCQPVSGTANLIEAETSPPISGYLLNQTYYLRPLLMNTGAVDLNLSKRGFVSVLKPNGGELAADEFNPALEYILKFNGNEMRIISPSF